jgi:hypothetical protein
MAIYFQDRARTYFLITNFKVLYSTLKRQDNLVIAEASATNDLLYSPHIKRYLLVRNPYDRAESFYRDKFVLYPRGVAFRDDFRWQHCQRIFFDELNLTGKSFEEIKKGLITTSFKQFIHLLPLKYRTDAHLIPQATAFNFAAEGKMHSIQFDRILKIEDDDSMDFLSDHLGIDVSIVENCTKSSNISTDWDPELRKVMLETYKDDFNLLAYDMNH